MVFCREKKMSTVTKVISPMFKRPRLRVSGFIIKKHILHCLVKMSTSIMWSILISTEWSSRDRLFFLVTGDRRMLHLGHFSIVGLNVLGHPELERVSLALHCLISFKIFLSGMLSLWYRYSAVFCMYFWVLEQLSLWMSQCSSLNKTFIRDFAGSKMPNIRFLWRDSNVLKMDVYPLVSIFSPFLNFLYGVNEHIFSEGSIFKKFA